MFRLPLSSFRLKKWLQPGSLPCTLAGWKPAACGDDGIARRLQAIADSFRMVDLLSAAGCRPVAEAGSCDWQMVGPMVARFFRSVKLGSCGKMMVRIGVVLSGFVQATSAAGRAAVIGGGCNQTAGFVDVRSRPCAASSKPTRMDHPALHKIRNYRLLPIAYRCQ
jgi:hypothetical protein